MARFSVTNPRKSRVLTGFMALYLIYTLVPLVWLIINASKTQPALFSTSGLSFGDTFALFDNIGQTFTYNGGIFFRWLGNTLLYVLVRAGGATILPTPAGHRPGQNRFPGPPAGFARGPRGGGA